MPRNKNEKEVRVIVALCGECMHAVPGGEGKLCPNCGEDTVCACKSCTSVLVDLMHETPGGELRSFATDWTQDNGVLILKSAKELHGTKQK